jgi:hypothetical protein
MLNIATPLKHGAKKRKCSTCFRVRFENSVRMDENPTIVHIDDRRLNMSMFDSSLAPSPYELLRAWVADDPERIEYQVVPL